MHVFEMLLGHAENAMRREEMQEAGKHCSGWAGTDGANGQGWGGGGKGGQGLQYGRRSKIWVAKGNIERRKGWGMQQMRREGKWPMDMNSKEDKKHAARIMLFTACCP